MLSNILHTHAVFMHTIAPAMIIILIGALVWLLLMAKKWKKADPERWYGK